MNYPLPDENPVCQCKGNPLAQFFCGYGHMTECHFPYDCSRAACSHLSGYDFPPEEIQRLEEDARADNSLYEYDEQGNATAKVSEHEPDPPAD